ncbi:MAG: phospholipase D-like domain-containing protein, partial [Clostridia bacterium]
ATKYVYISTPYFIIDKEFIGMVELACKSGVEVNILVPHIPDKKFVFFTTRAHYGDILRAGGKIYEFTPGFNHAKNFIVDDKYAFCGTTNCDYRSLYLHFECGSLLINNTCIKDMKEDFEKALSVSEEITMEKWKKRKYKIMEFFAYLIAPLL